jgi:hypothetical protein
MRLSEKTIELNFCAQVTSNYERGAFWFGLTQRQEAEAGFDVASRLGGRLVLLQFKASNTVLRSGGRRFHLRHGQLENLRERSWGSRERSVFYVLPNLGDTSELSAGRGDLLARSWLLDVASLPPIGLPTKANGSLRKNETHYADLIPPLVTIHSDPIKTSVLRADEFFADSAPGVDGIDLSAFHEKVLGEQEERQPSQRPKLFERGAVGLVLF